MTKRTELEKRPHYINLPEGARSPSGSIYGQYDIIEQGYAIWSVLQVGRRTLRSRSPFSVVVQVGNRAPRVIKSKRSGGEQLGGNDGGKHSMEGSTESEGK